MTDNKPDFVFQNGDLSGPEERRQWIRKACVEQRAQGANHFRASIHEDFPKLTMVEGWKENPDWNAIPPQEWGLVILPSPPSQ